MKVISEKYELCIAPHLYLAQITLQHSNTIIEYVLGTRVLLKSLQMSGTKHDILVLVSSNVRQSSRELFQQEGAKVIEVIPHFALQQRTED